MSATGAQPLIHVATTQFGQQVKALLDGGRVEEAKKIFVACEKSLDAKSSAFNTNCKTFVQAHLDGNKAEGMEHDMITSFGEMRIAVNEMMVVHRAFMEKQIPLPEGTTLSSNDEFVELDKQRYLTIVKLIYDDVVKDRHNTSKMSIQELLISAENLDINSGQGSHSG